MSDTLDKLEHTLDQRMGLLADHLGIPNPRRECIEQVKAVVAREAVRVEQQARRLRLYRRWGAVAAALLLAASLGWPPPGGPTADLAPANATEMLAEWAAAIEQSSERVTILLTDDWISERSLTPGDEEQELENLLQSLDQSRSLLAGA
jgi:hypothetical protein